MNKTGEETACCLTISKELQDGQVHMSLPERLLLDGDAVPRGGKDVATANGHQLAALVFASHVIQHSSIIDKGIQFPCRGKKKIFT